MSAVDREYLQVPGYALRRRAHVSIGGRSQPKNFIYRFGSLGAIFPLERAKMTVLDLQYLVESVETKIMEWNNG